MRFIESVAYAIAMLFMSVIASLEQLSELEKL